MLDSGVVLQHFPAPEGKLLTQTTSFACMQRALPPPIYKLSLTPGDRTESCPYQDPACVNFTEDGCDSCLLCHRPETSGKG
jgi:hypothetical protein